MSPPSPAVLWVMAGVVLVIAELLTGTFLLLILGAAALGGALLAWLGQPFAAQAVAAGLLAVTGLALLPRLRLRLQGRGADVSIDVGQSATFETWTDAGQRVARVRYRGAPWEALVEAGADPEPGGAVRVTAVDGTRLRVAGPSP